MVIGVGRFSTPIGGRVSSASLELDPGLADRLAEQAEEGRFQREREHWLLEEHGWAPGTEVMLNAGVDAGMRHLVGRVGRVRRCAWRAGRLMCEVVVPPPPPMPVVNRDGHVSWPRLRAIDQIPTALWVPAGALQVPSPSFRPPEGMSTAAGPAETSVEASVPRLSSSNRVT